MRTRVLLLFAALALSLCTASVQAGPLAAQLDTDQDGILNARDNCTTLSNPWQVDTDRDGIGDPCDPDRDGDGIVNILDNCPLVANRMQSDGNRDGVGDRCDAPITEIARGD